MTQTHEMRHLQPTIYRATPRDTPVVSPAGITSTSRTEVTISSATDGTAPSVAVARRNPSAWQTRRRAGGRAAAARRPHGSG